MQPADHHRLTHDEYFALETETGEKYEYCRGEVFAMGAGTIEHAALQLTVANAVMNRLRGRPCKSFSSDLRVYIQAVDLYTYPDLSVVCGPPRSQGDHALLNPTLLVEVLSPSTEAYDRGEKFALYQQLESLQQYMLVSQDRHRVELYTRRPEGVWTYEAFNGPEATVRLTAIGCDVPLAELYSGIELQPSPPHRKA